MTVPVQKHLTPSSFSDIIHPAGSLSSLQVYARSTLIYEEVDGPNLEGLKSLESLSSLSSRYDLSDLQEEIPLERCEMASSVMAVMDKRLPEGFFVEA